MQLGSKMEPATGVAIFQGGIEVGKQGWSFWNWYDKRRHGVVSFTSHNMNDVITPGWITVAGKHDSAKGFYWLISPCMNEYWPKTKLRLHEDGSWKERVHIGDQDGPRKATVSVMRVSRFMDEILTDIRWRSDQGKNWSPIKMVPPANYFLIVASIVFQVQGKSTISDAK